MIDSMDTERQTSVLVAIENLQIDSDSLISTWKFKPGEEELVRKGVDVASDYLSTAVGGQPKKVLEEIIGRGFHHWQEAEGGQKLIGWGELTAGIAMADKLGLAVVSAREGKTAVAWQEGGLKQNAKIKGMFLLVEKGLLEGSEGGKSGAYEAEFDDKKMILTQFLAEGVGRAPIVEGRFGHLRYEGSQTNELVTLVRSQSGKEIEIPSKVQEKFKGQCVTGFRRAGEDLLELVEEGVEESENVEESQIIAGALTALTNGMRFAVRIYPKKAKYDGAIDALGKVGDGLVILPQAIGERIQVKFGTRSGYLDDGVVYIPVPRSFSPDEKGVDQEISDEEISDEEIRFPEYDGPEKVDWVDSETGEVTNASIDEYWAQQWWKIQLQQKEVLKVAEDLAEMVERILEGRAKS